MTTSSAFNFGLCTFKVYLICITLALSLVLCVHSAHQNSGSGGPKTYSIYWNISTDVFRIDNTDHVYDINKGNSKFEYDQMNIVCPLYNSGNTKDEDTEKYMIYNVSKEEYETCRITNPNPRVIAVCDKPFKKLYFTITFRPFSPQPGGLEFLPGHNYYFISTSSKDDLHRRIGGRCVTHNMKVLFKVHYPSDANLSTTTLHAPTIPYTSWHFVTPSQDLSSSSTLEDDRQLIHYHHPVTSTVHPIINKTTKKVKTYDKHPNDVEKSSLTRSTSSGKSHSQHLGLTLSSIILMCYVSSR